MEKANYAKWQIISGEGELDSNAEFVLGLQKAMLRALLENKKINMRQYESAIELLENKKRKR